MLLSLPTELRLRVLELSISQHIYHVTAQDIFTKSNDSVEVVLTRCDCCPTSKRRYLQALTLTCRLLAVEANDIFYRQTTLVFTSMKAADIFFGQRDSALRNVHSLSMYCGAAKHLSKSQKQNKRRVLYLLRKHARHLTDLHFCFKSYYGIDQDKHLLNNFWNCSIGRFRGLRRLSMSIDLDMLGPIGAAHVSDADQEHIQSKLHHIESALRLQVYR